ncbi:MAG: hypothetical protein AAGE01_20775 [Pseudomonadota bacterium]
MRYLTPIVILLLATACTGDTRAVDIPIDPGKDPFLMQTYAVPAEAADEISRSIAFLLGGGDQSIGRATVIGTDRIAIAAPASAHTGVRQLIEAAIEGGSEAPPRIRVEYWLIDAEPGAPDGLPATLAELEPALEAIVTSLGPMAFDRIDYAQHILQSGSRAEVDGRVLQGNVNAVARGDRIVADFRLLAVWGQGAPQPLSTRVDLQDGELLVLAVASDTREEATGFSAFVVRATTF